MVRHLLDDTEARVVNIDKLTYAANLNSRPGAPENPHYSFEKADICEGPALRILFEKYQPDAVMNLAAESHVDRSIDGPGEFIQTNIVGTFTLLQEALRYWRGLDPATQRRFRFHHISTDEVYGSLGDEGLFTETTAYAPNSPYSASKASSDHLVRAWRETYGLPTIVTNCSNNYGPYHFPEKLIPAHDHQGPGGRAAAGLWRRPEHPRLALCRGSCASADAGAGARRGRRDLQYRRPQRAHQPACRDDNLPVARRKRPKRLRQGSRKPFAGIAITVIGGKQFSIAATRRSGSAYRKIRGESLGIERVIAQNIC